MEWTQVLEAIAVAIAALSFAFGVNAWRREFVGKRQIELAEEILTGFYEARDAIKTIRSPWSHSDEGSSRKRGESESREETELLNRAFIVHERFEKKQEVFNRLKTLRYRCMAHFGTHAGDLFIEMDKVVKEIFVASYMLGTHYWQAQRRSQSMSPQEFEKHLSAMQIHQAVLWEDWENPDPINSRLTIVVDGVESLCRPVIMKGF